MQATALLEFGEFHIAGHAGKKKGRAVGPFCPTHRDRGKALAMKYLVD